MWDEVVVSEGGGVDWSAMCLQKSMVGKRKQTVQRPTTLPRSAPPSSTLMEAWHHVSPGETVQECVTCDRGLRAMRSRARTHGEAYAFRVSCAVH